MDDEFTPADEAEENEDAATDSELTETTEPSPSASDGAERGVSSDLIRGHINTIILRALYDGDKYGYEIIAEIESKSKGQYSLKQPSLYSALKRLEKDGYVTSYWGGSVSGGRRKYFSLTEEGKAIAERNQSEWEYSRTIIDSLISDRDFDFSKPAPTAVDMRVLRSTTSRVPSREGGSDDEEETFIFEPATDEPSARDALEAEYRAKLEEMQAEYDKKTAELEEQIRAAHEELQRAQTGVSEEQTRLREELEAREVALRTQRETQEAEFKARCDEWEQLLRERYKQEDAERTALEEQARKAEEERAALARQLESERTAHETELREMRIAGDESLRIERENQEQRLREQQEAHERALQEQQEAHERAMQEQQEAHERELSERQAAIESAVQEQHNSDEEALRRQQSESSEEIARRDVIIEEERRHVETLQTEHEGTLAALHAREEELAAQRTQISEDRARYEAQIAEDRARYEAQCNEDRARYQQALAEQEDRLRRAYEEEMKRREQLLIHQNYISLVSGTPQTSGTSPYAPPSAQTAQDPTPQSGDYRTVVENLYANSASGNAAAEDPDAVPVSGMDLSDVRSRASRDGLRITTAGETAPVVRRDENVVHKGKALFLSAVVVFFFCLAVGGIAMGLQKRLELPFFYPYIIWGVGLVFLLVTGLAYANHYGENWLRRSVPVLINSIVIFIILVILSLIVALSVKIDFANVNLLSTYLFIPALFFLGVPLFGVCYYLQIRPLKDKTDHS